MDGMTKVECPWNRAAESLGNSVELQHVNLRVPDQTKATAFYISALGLTRDPYLVTGIDNMWANVGVSQFPGSSATSIRSAWPATASSMALSRISAAKWCRAFSSVPPIYMPGRRRTGSSPSRTSMSWAE